MSYNIKTCAFPSCADIRTPIAETCFNLYDENYVSQAFFLVLKLSIPPCNCKMKYIDLRLFWPVVDVRNSFLKRFTVTIN